MIGTELLTHPVLVAPVPMLATDNASFVFDALSAGATVLIAAFTAFAAWQAFRTVKEAARSATTSHFYSRKQATIQYLTSVRRDYLESGACIRDLMRQNIDIEPTKGDQAKVDTLQHNVTHLLSIWEHLSAGVNSGVFDTEIVNDMVGPRLMIHYHNHLLFIRAQRRKDIGNYDQLELLIDRLYEMRRSAYVITRKTLDRLQERFVSSRVIRRLKRLKRRTFNNYQELCKELIEQDLHTEKHLITALSRQVPYSIVPYEQSFATDVVALCKKVCKSLKYTWPSELRKYKDNPDEWENELSRWLRGALNQFKCYCAIHKADAKRQIVGCIALQPVLSTTDEKSLNHWEKVLEINDRDKLNEIVLIRRIFVLPEYTRNGIGTMLLRHAIRVINEGESVVPEIQQHENLPGLTGSKIAYAEIPFSLSGATELILKQGGRQIKQYNDDKGGDDMRVYII